MPRIVSLVTTAALGAAALVFAGSPDAVAGGKHHGHKKHHKGDKDVCKYAAHGSEQEEKNDAKGAGGSGGGKPANDCSKVFAKWGDASVTVYVSNAGAPAGLSTALSDYADNCFSTWQCSSGLSVSVSTNPDDAAGADITVAWDDLGSTGILGQTTTWYGGGLISDSIVEMNNNTAFNWTLGPSQGTDGNGCFSETSNGNTSTSNYDLISVLLHEVGHALGVSHPTSRCSSRDACYSETMNPCTDAEEYMRRTLGSGDIKSIQTNYGQ